VESGILRATIWRRYGVVLAVMALAAGGCLAATSSASPGSSEGASGSATEPALPSTSASTEPTSTTDSTDLSNVPLAPSGAWKSIRWVYAPAAPLLATPSLAPDTSGVFSGATTLMVAGWSRGYVGLSTQTVTTEPGDKTATTTTSIYSSDGVHWHAGGTVRQPASIDNMDIRAVYEGPAGLLAVEESGACGDTWVDGLLTSKDGVTWQAVDMGKAFGKAVIWNVSGGSAGFVTTDTTGTRAWTSHDGRSWQSDKLGTPAFARSRIDDGTAFSAGFVLAGSTEVTGARSCGAATFDPDATPAPTPPLRIPAVWYSADGSSWVKADLPGAKPAYPIQMAACRLDDHTIAVYGSGAWLSSDGRTWKPMTASLGYAPLGGFTFDTLGNGSFLTDGRHGIQIQGLKETVEDPYAGGASLSTWTDGRLVTLAQSGHWPTYEFSTQWAVGPTGILVIDDGRLWIGLPSTN